MGSRATRVKGRVPRSGARPSVVETLETSIWVPRSSLLLARRQPQRRVLLRLRRNQEPVRYPGQTELYRASSGRQVSLDRRGFQYRSKRIFDCDRAADQRTQSEEIG